MLGFAIEDMIHQISVNAIINKLTLESGEKTYFANL